MSAQNLEALLARLYTDAAARAGFRADPRGESRKAGLSDEECRSLEGIDWVGVEMAARSFAIKRQRKGTNSALRRVFSRLRQALPL